VLRSDSIPKLNFSSSPPPTRLAVNQMWVVWSWNSSASADGASGTLSIVLLPPKVLLKLTGDVPAPTSTVMLLIFR